MKYLLTFCMSVTILLVVLALGYIGMQLLLFLGPVTSAILMVFGLIWALVHSYYVHVLGK